MMRLIAHLSVFILVAGIPFGVFAAEGGIVPCGKGTDPCTFGHFLVLAKNIVDFVLQTVIVPLATISFAVAGIYYLGGAVNEKNVSTAKEILRYTAGGLVLALAAWGLVRAALTFFITDPTLIQR